MWSIGLLVIVYVRLLPVVAMASYAKVYQGHCLPIPDHLEFCGGSLAAETVFTVWDNVFRRGKLQADDHFLVHGGAGGIGSTAIQLATLFGAVVVYDSQLI
jgi:NADPH:quinone reductase-like Zn-dependent oxidoreductase